jgi:hypothetical protein
MNEQGPPEGGWCLPELEGWDSPDIDPSAWQQIEFRGPRHAVPARCGVNSCWDPIVGPDQPYAAWAARFVVAVDALSEGAWLAEGLFSSGHRSIKKECWQLPRVRVVRQWRTGWSADVKLQTHVARFAGPRSRLSVNTFPEPFSSPKWRSTAESWLEFENDAGRWDKVRDVTMRANWSIPRMRAWVENRIKKELQTNEHPNILKNGLLALFRSDPSGPGAAITDNLFNDAFRIRVPSDHRLKRPGRRSSTVAAGKTLG